MDCTLWWTLKMYQFDVLSIILILPNYQFYYRVKENYANAPLISNTFE